MIAQTSDLGRTEAERPKQAALDRRLTQRAAEQAQLLPELGEEEVSYAQVLDDPDNIQLNFLYAQTQLRHGDLRGASATLERILLVRPSLGQARLLYAVVLYRLDDLFEAERQFRRTLKSGVPPQLQREIEAYIERIETRQRTTRFGFNSTLGLQWNSNRNASPDELLIGDALIPVPEDATKQGDVALIGIFGANFEYDLPTAEGDKLFATVDWYTQTQRSFSDLNLQSATVQAGGLIRTSWAELRPTALIGLSTLGLDIYMKRYGAGLQATRALFDRRIQAFADLRLEYQDFEELPDSPTAPERTGPRLEAGGGISAILGTRHFLTIMGHYLDKQAERSDWNYDGVRVTSQYTLLLGKGQFVSTLLSFEHNRYHDADLVVSLSPRYDNRWRARLSYGVPLGRFISGATGSEFLNGILATASAGYFGCDSNLPNYDFDDWTGSLMFTKQWNL